MLIARLIRFAKVEQKCKLRLDGIRCNYSTAIIPKPRLYNLTHPLPFIHQPTFQNVTKSCGFSSSSFLRQRSARMSSKGTIHVLLAVVVVQLCLALGFFFYHLKKVPYSHRWRLLICSAVNERKLGDEMLKARIDQNNYKDAILPATHPQYLLKGDREADYISLRLMASAGYDPRVIPQAYEKVDEMSRAGCDCLKERIRVLSQPHVMEEALTIYRQTMGNQVSRRT